MARSLRDQLLNLKGNIIMPGVSEFANQENANLAAVSAALDGLVTGIAALDQLITNFENSPGTLTPADQAALDGIVAASAALVAKAQAISTAPPTPPAARK